MMLDKNLWTEMWSWKLNAKTSPFSDLFLVRQDSWKGGMWHVPSL